jgi:hypothetical protein
MCHNHMEPVGDVEQQKTEEEKNFDKELLDMIDILD